MCFPHDNSEELWGTSSTHTVTATTVDQCINLPQAAAKLKRYFVSDWDLLINVQDANPDHDTTGFYVSSEVLVKTSQYFRALLGGGMQESMGKSQTGCNEWKVVLKDVESPYLESILGVLFQPWIRNGISTMDLGDLHELVRTSDYFLSTDIIREQAHVRLLKLMENKHSLQQLKIGGEVAFQCASIAYKLGESSLFRAAITHIAFNMFREEGEDGHWIAGDWTYIEDLVDFYQIVPGSTRMLPALICSRQKTVNEIFHLAVINTWKNLKVPYYGCPIHGVNDFPCTRYWIDNFTQTLTDHQLIRIPFNFGRASEDYCGSINFALLKLMEWSRQHKQMPYWKDGCASQIRWMIGTLFPDIQRYGTQRLVLEPSWESQLCMLHDACGRAREKYFSRVDITPSHVEGRWAMLNIAYGKFGNEDPYAMVDSEEDDYEFEVESEKPPMDSKDSVASDTRDG